MRVELQGELEDIPVISARSIFEPLGVQEPYRWKAGLYPKGLFFQCRMLFGRGERVLHVVMMKGKRRESPRSPTSSKQASQLLKLGGSNKLPRKESTVSRQRLSA